MKHHVAVPSAGESVTEAYIGTWKKKSGEAVKKGDVIVELESQKATFELEAEAAGVLQILKPTPGDKVQVGDIIAVIDDAAKPGVVGEIATPAHTSTTPLAPPQTSPIFATSAAPAVQFGAPAPTTDARFGQMGPAARRRLMEGGMPQHAVSTAGAAPAPKKPAFTYAVDTARGEVATRASRIRRHIAENLVAAQHTAAILTSFNEVDMSAVMALRKKYKDAVKAKHGVSMGMVGVFAMAAVRALKQLPIVNSTFTGEDIITRDFIDLSIAVSTDKGLVVPVIRDVQKMNLIQFEQALSAVAEKARAGKLSIPEMTGGTFTITNGGVFGSLLSTPLLNMPQTAILGLHKIEERPVAIDGKVEIRPMMYIALSYDHRLIDGKEAVQFLVAVKEGIEKPSLIIDEEQLA